MILEELPMNNCTALTAIDVASARTLSPRASFFLLASITVSFLAQPAPLVQDGTTRLYYEMVVTNFARDSYVLDAVEACPACQKRMEKNDRRPVAKNRRVHRIAGQRYIHCAPPSYSRRP